MTTKAHNTEKTFKTRLLFDCYAINQASLALLEQQGVSVVSLAGRKAPGHGHPNWDWLQTRRDPDGRLIPNLLSWFRAGSPDKIAVMGFSAGCNSGLRQLLRHPEDREMICFCGAIDGLHPIKNYKGEIADWRQLAPIAEYALKAANGSGTCIITGNNLAAPSSTTFATPQSMKIINEYVIKSRAGVFPTNTNLMYEFHTTSPVLASNIGGIGNCYFYEYPGTRAQDHINQTKLVIPAIINTFLKAAW